MPFWESSCSFHARCIGSVLGKARGTVALAMAGVAWAASLLLCVQAAGKAGTPAPYGLRFELFKVSKVVYLTQGGVGAWEGL